MADFQKVLKLDELPVGTGKCVNVNGNEVGLFNCDGKVYAIENNCAHQGGPLSEGTLSGTIVTCPWHNWKFDVTTGDSPVVPTANVNTFEAKVEDDEIWVKA